MRSHWVTPCRSPYEYNWFTTEYGGPSLWYLERETQEGWKDRRWWPDPQAPEEDVRTWPGPLILSTAGD